MSNCYDCCDLCHPCPCDHDKPDPFLSSYLEAVGNTQTVAENGNFIFDITNDALDIAGSDIEIDSTGSVFTLLRKGLYHIEWSMNLSSATAPVLVGLLEGGAPASALSNSNVTGNFSSGALINVKRGDAPVTVSLHNFGLPVSVENPLTALNTAVSIRILRFADGENRKYYSE